MLGEATGPETCTITHVIVPGDRLWNLASKYLGDPNRWQEIYNANQAVIENAAAQHPGPPVFGTSDHGHWIFPGTALTIPGATCPSSHGGSTFPGAPQGGGLASLLTPEQRQVVVCVANVAEAYAELRAKSVGKALRRAKLKELAKLLKKPTVIDALTKPIGVLKACGPLAGNAGGLVGRLVEALRKSPELDHALGDFIVSVGAVECLDTITSVRPAGLGINPSTGKLVKDILDQCPVLFEKAGTVHSALKELGIPTVEDEAGSGGGGGAH